MGVKETMATQDKQRRICNSIIGIWAEHLLLGYNTVSKKPWTYHFEYLSLENCKDGHVEINCEAYVGDWVESETIEVPIDWIDNYNPQVVRDAAAKLVKSKDQQLAVEAAQAAKERRDKDLQLMNELIEKYPFDALSKITGIPR